LEDHNPFLPLPLFVIPTAAIGDMQPTYDLEKTTLGSRDYPVPRKNASGVYLVVEEEDFKDRLAVTSGGNPHITIAYQLSPRTHETHRVLMALGYNAVNYFRGLPMTLTHAYANSFEMKPGVWRHDVLFGFSETDTRILEGLQTGFLSSFANLYSTLDTAVDQPGTPKRLEEARDVKFSQNTPHVSYRYCETKEEQEATLQAVKDFFPIEISITGVTY